MSDKPEVALPDFDLGSKGNLAFIIVVIIAYVSTFSVPTAKFTLAQIAALVIAGIIYSILGIYGFAFCERGQSLPMLLVYFAIQLLLGMFVAYLSSGMGWIITLPLVAQAVVVLPGGWVLLLCGLVTFAFALIVGLGSDVGVLQASMQYLAAVIFVAVFTQVAAGEQKARTEVERLAAKLGEANRQLREYAVQVEELATVRERNRIAREIHDSVGHYLTTVNMQLEAARAVMAQDPSRALDALSKAQSLTKEGLADVRRSVAALRASPTETLPLPEAIAALVKDLPAELTVKGTPRPLAPQAELALYRTAQEGLTNVRKHAHATQVGLVLDYSDDARVRLSVQDNGVGTAGLDSGFGLIGVRERVQLLGGCVNIHTAADQGFQLKVELPG